MTIMTALLRTNLNRNSSDAYLLNFYHKLFYESSSNSRFPESSYPMTLVPLCHRPSPSFSVVCKKSLNKN